VQCRAPGSSSTPWEVPCAMSSTTVDTTCCQQNLHQPQPHNKGLKVCALLSFQITEWKWLDWMFLLYIYCRAAIPGTFAGSCSSWASSRLRVVSLNLVRFISFQPTTCCLLLAAGCCLQRMFCAAINGGCC
jgi:hypothetical protein